MRDTKTHASWDCWYIAVSNVVSERGQRGEWYGNTVHCRLAAGHVSGGFAFWIPGQSIHYKYFLNIEYLTEKHLKIKLLIVLLLVSSNW